MSKTIYIDGNPAEGVPGTIVTADFLNKVNNHHHTGRDIDGEGALAYAADTGEANAYVLSLSPALDAYITGMPICFNAENANTGASTIDINGLGTKTIKKNGSEDLSIGDILAGQIVTVIYDGTNFQLMAAPRALALRDAARGLVVKNNATNPNYQVDISADEIILQDASGNPMRVLNLSATADITVSGAGGLDTGAEATSTWYHLWVIAKADGTKSAVLSASATAPTLPSGYAHKAYMGAVYNNSSGNFANFHQTGRRVIIAQTTALQGGTQTTCTSISLAAIIPATAKKISGIATAAGTAGVYPAISLAASNNDTYGWGRQVVHVNVANISTNANFTMTLKTAQTMCYYVDVVQGGGSGGACLVHITGYEY